MFLNIDHPDITGKQSTYLKEKAAAAAVALKVRSNVGFVANQLIVVGGLASENAQIVKVTSLTSDDQLNVTPALKFDVAQDSPVTNILYDQIKVYKSATKTGAYALLATINVAIDESNTPYDDAAGLSTDWYRVSYYNSVSASESAQSAPTSSAGVGFYSLQSMVDRVMATLIDQNQRNLYMTEVKSWLNEQYEKAYGAIINIDQEYSLVSLPNQALIADQQEYDLPAACTTVKRLEISYDSVEFADATPEKLNDMEIIGGTEQRVRSGETYDKSKPYYYQVGNKFGARPKPTAAGLYNLWYYSLFTPLADPTDELARPLKAYSTIFVDYAKGHLFAKVGNDGDARAAFKRSNDGLQDMLVEIGAQQDDLSGAMNMLVDVE